jgi:hypothetical protein
VATQAARDAAAKCLKPVLPPDPECTEAMRKAQQAAADVAQCVGTAIQGCQLGVEKGCEKSDEKTGASLQGSCGNCGAHTAPDQHFCSSCGSPV